MLITLPPRGKSLVLVGIVFALLGIEHARAQAPQGRGAYPQSEEDRTEERQQPQSQVQQNEPFIHGVSLGVGLAVYQGDFSRNPNHNIVKYIAGSGALSLRLGADHRLGRFDQYGLGADLVYNRLSGETTGGSGFKANSLALDFYGDYELPYVAPGLFRVFLGVGPNLIISPTYQGFPESTEGTNYERLGTRVSGSFKVGVTIYDQFRVGTRIAFSDLVDGYKGFDPDGVPDFISFLNFSYRFDVN
jgi:hypothetical protein